MGKRNKIRYQSTSKQRIAITLTGNVYLLYQDDELLAGATKGDLMVFPQNDALRSTRLGEYRSTGFSGYFKVDVHDGRDWRPLLIQDIFSHNEHHFSKRECPIDTYAVIKQILQEMHGTPVIRTYREHYVPEDTADPQDAEGRD